MPHSLKAKLSGLKHKEIITNEEYQRLCNALDLEKELEHKTNSTEKPWNCEECEHTEEECKGCYPELGYKNNKLKRDTEAIKKITESGNFKKLENEPKKQREEAIKTLRVMRNMMMNSDNWESMKDLVDAVTLGAFAIQRLNEIDYSKSESEGQ